MFVLKSSLKTYLWNQTKMFNCKGQFPYLSLKDEAASVLGGIDKSKSDLSCYNSALICYEAIILILISD